MSIKVYCEVIISRKGETYKLIKIYTNDKLTAKSRAIFDFPQWHIAQIRGPKFEVI